MKRLKTCIIVLSSLFCLLAPKKIATACGFSVAPGEYRFWLLQPDLSNAPGLSPFFFATTPFYRDEITKKRGEHLDSNINEWYRYTNKAVLKKDIESVLYDTKPASFLEHFDSLRKVNSFARYLATDDHKELLQYMRIAKSTEQVFSHPDMWGDDQYSHYRISKIIVSADSLYRLKNSPFVQLRLAYQLTRLYRYDGQAVQVRKIYDERVGPVKTGSWIKAAALYEKAKVSVSTESDYLYSKVFDMGNFERSWCILNMRTKNEDQVMALAKNEHERTVIKAMGICRFAGRALNKIKDIYAKEPAYKELPFLLLREINKTEDWLVTSKITDFDPATRFDTWQEGAYNKIKNFKEDTAYAGKLYLFIDQVIRENKSSNPALLQLYAAHIAMIRENYTLSQHHLQELKKYTGLQANIRTQVKVNELLLYVLMHDTFDDYAQRQLMAILQTPDNRLALNSPDIMKDQLILFIAKKMIARGERGKGFLLLSRTNRAIGELPIGNYKTVFQEMEEKALPADYDYILQVLDKRQKSPFEKFVVTGYFASPKTYNGEYGEERDSPVWDRNKVLDCKATWYIGKGNPESALKTLQQIPWHFWKKEPYATHIKGNPFFLNIYSAHNIDPKEGNNCNKKEVLEKMEQLRQAIPKEPANAAQYYFELGNAWYNMSWYGKNWLMMRQWWSSSEIPDYSTIQRSSFNDIYYGCTKAKENYLQAMKLTKDKKLAALCCFMAATCEDNFRKYTWHAAHKKSFSYISNQYVDLLKKKGFDEDYYNDLVTECATYQSFIRQYNRWRK